VHDGEDTYCVVVPPAIRRLVEALTVVRSSAWLDREQVADLLLVSGDGRLGPLLEERSHGLLSDTPTCDSAMSKRFMA
jgi:hypothetical protein